jgi:aquaporin Z
VQMHQTIVFPYQLFLVLANVLLMAVIFTVVYTKGLGVFSGIAIRGIVGLDIFFLAFFSGASMNPARSLAAALLSGVLGNLFGLLLLLEHQLLRLSSKENLSGIIVKSS